MNSITCNQHNRQKCLWVVDALDYTGLELLQPDLQLIHFFKIGDASVIQIIQFQAIMTTNQRNQIPQPSVMLYEMTKQNMVAIQNV